METQHDCEFKNCIMKKVPILAYIIAYNFKIRYPAAWNRNKEVGRMWVKYFVDTYKYKISKFPCVCMNEMSTNIANDSKLTISRNYS